MGKPIIAKRGRLGTSWIAQGLQAVEVDTLASGIGYRIEQMDSRVATNLKCLLEASVLLCQFLWQLLAAEEVHLQQDHVSLCPFHECRLGKYVGLQSVAPAAPVATREKADVSVNWFTPKTLSMRTSALASATVASGTMTRRAA